MGYPNAVFTSGGFYINLHGVSQAASSVNGLANSGTSVTSNLSATAANPLIFAGIGSGVADTDSLLDAHLNTGLNGVMSQFDVTSSNIQASVRAYIQLDQEIAQSYTLVAGTGFATKAGPGNEPLPPYNTASPSVQDRLLRAALITGALPLFSYHGWWNAEGMLSHYLDATGTDYKIDPSKLMQDVPSFQKQVQNIVNSHLGQGPFQSAWQNANTDLRGPNGQYQGQQNLDWFWGMHDWRYQVTGNSVIDPSGNITTQYTVDVFKPYIFGAPRSDIPVPGTGGSITVTQDQIENLNTVGLARNFNIVGSSTFTQVTSP